MQFTYQISRDPTTLLLRVTFAFKPPKEPGKVFNFDTNEPSVSAYLYCPPWNRRSPFFHEAPNRTQYPVISLPAQVLKEEPDGANLYFTCPDAACVGPLSHTVVGQQIVAYLQGIVSSYILFVDTPPHQIPELEAAIRELGRMIVMQAKALADGPAEITRGEITVDTPGPRRIEM